MQREDMLSLDIVTGYLLHSVSIATLLVVVKLASSQLFYRVLLATYPTADTKIYIYQVYL